MGISFIGPSEAFSGTVTGTDPVDSLAFDIRRYPACSFQAVYIGDLEATFLVLGSLDGVNYSDSGAFVPAAIGSDGNSLVNLSNIGFPWVKFRITPTSGSSEVTVKFSAKEG